MLYLCRKTEDKKEAQASWPVIVHNMVKVLNTISSPSLEHVHI